MEGWAVKRPWAAGWTRGPGPGMRTARGETNFGGGSEGGQFCVGGAVLGPAPPEQKLAPLTPPGCSRVSAVFRSVAQSEWSSSPAHRLGLWSCASGGGRMERSRSVGKAGESRAYGDRQVP